MFKGVLAASVCLASLCAAHANAGKLTKVATVIGICKTLIVQDIQASCSNKVVNLELPNGENGFTFFANGKDGHDAVISFYGNGKNERHPDPDTAVQIIDEVNITLRGKTDHYVTSGVGKFTNPFKGTPALIHCASKTDHGLFAGEFISNGVAPIWAEIP
jgi:hypothetical protein